jgi:hypothetical protein
MYDKAGGRYSKYHISKGKKKYWSIDSAWTILGIIAREDYQRTHPTVSLFEFSKIVAGLKRSTFRRIASLS